MPGRSFAAGSGYRYGFNGMERDLNIGIESYTTEHRIFDSRIGRWLSVDPLEEDGPEYSPYCNSFNNPIILSDPNGDWPDFPSLSDIGAQIKSSYNNAKSYVSAKATSASNYVSSKYNQAANYAKEKVNQIDSNLFFINPSLH